ncbi:FYVE zinc finger [Trypanosoma melophagium]|uniref:FYVE zinc finger n=1 Tax=Trypanosoma melophagium TaxID=715481 RepID=UPI003519F227|nr:FYVE zinc finger [Trypanosoma melophagium]
MSFNLDDLFDTRPRQQQVASPAHVPPPPPSDPPPPPMIHQDPFGVHVTAPSPPPPPPFDVAVPPVPLGYAVPPTNGSTTTTTTIPLPAAAVVPNLVHPQQVYGSINVSQPTNPNVYAVPPGSTPLQTAYMTPPSTSGTSYAPSHQTAGLAMALPSGAPNGTTAAFVPPQVVPAAEPTLNQNKYESTLSQEEEDKRQLEKIIQLRKELEKERERERKKREELETWGCPSCTYRNALTVNQCEMCDSNRPGYNPPVDVVASRATRGGSAPLALPSTKSVSAVSGPPGQTSWICSICLAPNQAQNIRCKVCNADQKNGTSVPVVTPSTTIKPAGWLCSICGKKNKVQSVRCETCSSYQSNGTPILDFEQAAPQPELQKQQASANETVPTTWTCSVCTLENSVSHAVCEACQSGQRPRHLAPSKAKEHNKKVLSGAQGNDNAPKKWPCPNCTFHNAIALEKCEMCSAPRPSQYKPPPPQSSTTTNSTKDARDSDDDIQWQDDYVATECNRCHLPFNFTRRRHHCRACGFLFCASCSPFQKVLKKKGKAERVCVSCYEANK